LRNTRTAHWWLWRAWRAGKRDEIYKQLTKFFGRICPSAACALQAILQQPRVPGGAAQDAGDGHELRKRVRDHAARSILASCPSFSLRTFFSFSRFSFSPLARPLRSLARLPAFALRVRLAHQLPANRQDGGRCCAPVRAISRDRSLQPQRLLSHRLRSSPAHVVHFRTGVLALPAFYSIFSYTS